MANIFCSPSILFFSIYHVWVHILYSYVNVGLIIVGHKWTLVLLKKIFDTTYLIRDYKGFLCFDDAVCYFDLPVIV